MDAKAKAIVTRLNEAVSGGRSTDAAINELKTFLDECRNANRRADFSQLHFVRANFQGMNLGATDFNETTFSGCNFDGTNLTGASLQGAQFIANGDRGTRLHSSALEDADFTDARLICEISSITFNNCTFDAADFRLSKLRRVDFRACTFDFANLSGVNVNDTVRFHNVESILRATIDRYTLASLGDNSGLTVANLMDVAIIDDVAKLRREFGGIWAIAHAAGVVVFVYPYAKFLFLQSLIARFNPPDGESVTLLSAMARFIVSGGQNWKAGWIINAGSLLAFMVYFAYNVARGALLWKTKRLETRQEVSGLPVRFSLSDSPWRQCYLVANGLFWFALVAVGYNTWHFLMQRVSID